MNLQAFFWRALIYSVVMAFIVAYAAWQLTPRIIIDNQSEAALDQVIIDLPSSRIVVDDMPASSQQQHFHSPSQPDGNYNYIVTLGDGQRRIGSCGHVTNNMWGAKMKVIVEPGFEVRCEVPLPDELSADG